VPKNFMFIACPGDHFPYPSRAPVCSLGARTCVQRTPMCCARAWTSSPSLGHAPGRPLAHTRSRSRALRTDLFRGNGGLCLCSHDIAALGGVRLITY
jgi:hypothetical protein